MTPQASAILLPYQVKWIEDRASVRVCEKGRRVGITWAEAADRALAASARAGTDTWYIGYDREMAQEFIRDVADWARRYQLAAAAIEEIALRDEDRDILAYQVRFASGHRVVALSSRPTGLRGRAGCAVIDEAAFHDDLNALLRAAIALTIWGGAVHVISTHNGAENPFADLVRDIRAGRLPYSLHRVTLDDALEQGLYRRICESTGRPWSEDGERAWRAELIEHYGEGADEELFCIPRGSGGAFLTGALIESRMRDDIPVIRWSRGDEFLALPEAERARAAEDFCVSQIAPALAPRGVMQFFGVDFGRTADLTVIWVLDMTPDTRRHTLLVVELRNVPFREQERVLFFIADRLPRLVAAALDARGNGQYLAEQARLRYGSRVEQVMLTEAWYREQMPRYKAALEDGMIDLPRDAEILSDHRSLVVERGVPRVPERRVRTGAGTRHGDSAIAAALAFYASSISPRFYAYDPAPRRRPYEPRLETREEFFRDDEDVFSLRHRRLEGF